MIIVNLCNKNATDEKVIDLSRSAPCRISFHSGLPPQYRLYNDRPAQCERVELRRKHECIDSEHRPACRKRRQVRQRLLRDAPQRSVESLYVYRIYGLGDRNAGKRDGTARLDEDPHSRQSYGEGGIRQRIFRQMACEHQFAACSPCFRIRESSWPQ